MGKDFCIGKGEVVWIVQIKGIVAQSVRALVLWAKSRGFEPHQDKCCNGDYWWGIDTYMLKFIFVTIVLDKSINKYLLSCWVIK